MKRPEGTTLLVLATLAWSALGLGALGVGASAADVLVTRDGAQVETEGPWEVKGRLVVFTRPGGTLSSIRLSEIDLEASDQATAEARRSAEAAASEQAKGEKEQQDQDGQPGESTERREATWKLTDSDFSRRMHVAMSQDSAEEGEGEEGEGEARQQRGPSPPVVLSYQREDDPVDGHVIVTGSLGNQTDTTATAISLEVSLYDEVNELIQMRRATLDDPVLTPGASTTFRAAFPDVFTYAAIQFRPRSTNLATGSRDIEGEGEDGGDGEDGEDGEDGTGRQ